MTEGYDVAGFLIYMLVFKSVRERIQGDGDIA
jgi:hypothetical protein